LRFDKLAADTGGTLYNSDNATRVFSGVSIDSRTLRGGELFIAIKGEQHDGHDYIAAAIDGGASGVITDDTYPRLDHLSGTVAVVSVENTHRAMLDLARAYRRRLIAKIIGITGSNGKTTAKELAYRLLQALAVRAYASPGNLNNLYGVPLAIFGIPKETAVAVLEMGISTNDEMPILAEIARPDVIIVTNVGPSHLQNFGTVANVAKAKLELVRKAAPGVPAILNADDDILMLEGRKIRKDCVTFAMDREADYRPSQIDVDDRGCTMVTIDGNYFQMTLPGRHQVYNLLAAYAAVRELGYDFDGIDTEQITFDTAPMRGQVIDIGGVSFVADCYNANPESVRVGLEAFFGMVDDRRRIVILGDMLELGSDEIEYHRRAGEQLAGYDFAHAALVGPLSEHVLAAAIDSGVKRDRLTHFEDTEQAAVALREQLREGDLVYVKASRGIGLERVMEQFRDKKRDV